MYEYKTISFSPDGIRIKGDDVSEKLSDLLNESFDIYAKQNWRVISILPSMKSEGAVIKVLVTFERATRNS